MLARRATFTTHGALSALPYAPGYTGRLPADWVARYRADAAQAVCVVLSYATPIAWVLDDGDVVIPDVAYSLTTTRPQRLCRVWM